MKIEQKGPINVLSKASVKKAAKSLLVATVIASQVFTVLPAGSFAAEATNPALPSADAAASKISIEPMSLALDNGVTERRAQVSTFAEFKIAAESTTINVIEITGNFQFTSNVSINSNIRIEGNGQAITAGKYQMVMRSTSIIDVQDLSITNNGTQGVFTGYNSTAAPTVNLTNNVQVWGEIMGGTGKLSLSIAGTNNKIVSPDDYGVEVDELIIKDNARIEELSALLTAVKVRTSGNVSIGDNVYINMNSNKGYAFDVATSALVIGENTVLKSASKYGTVRAATLVAKNGSDLTLASGDSSYGIYVTGNITFGDDVKLKATGTGTAVYAYNTGAAIVVGKNANIDIVSDNGYGIYGNASITFGDGSSLKLRTQNKAIYSAGSAAITFGTVSNQPKAAADRVKIDIDSAISDGIYSAGGPILFGDDTEVNVKAKSAAIYAAGNSRVTFGANTKTTISSSNGRGIDAGGVKITDNSSMDIKGYVDGIYTNDTSGEGLSTGKNVNLNITASSHDGIYTAKDTTFGANNTVVIKALNSHAMHSLYGSVINIGADSSYDLSGTEGVQQAGGAAAALNVGANSTVKISAVGYGINTTGSVTFATGSKANIRAASQASKAAVKANGVVTFQKDTMAYVEALYPSTTYSVPVFDLSGASNSKLVLNSPKFIDFRQNNNNATSKTGHIVKGAGTATVANQSRVEINNVKNLMAWNHGTDWSKAANTAWTDIDLGRVTLSSKNGTATTSYYGGVASGIDGFSLFDYTRLSTEGSSAIARPVVSPIYAGAKTVTGTGVAGNDIIVTFPNGSTAKATVKQDGTWTVDVPAGVNLLKDQSVVSYQTNGVNDSPNVTTKVQEDLRAPAAPTVNDIKEGDTTVTGKAEPNKDITVTLPDGTKVPGKTDANGDFTVTVPAQKEGDEVKVTQKGDNGVESPETSKIVASNQKPVITAANKTIKVGDTFAPLTGVTATDKEDGILTSKVTVTANNVDTTKAGTYNVTYSVTDSDGNKVTKTITVTVKTNEKPVITASNQSIKMGTTFNPLTGVTATDSEDGNLTSKVTVTANNVDTTKEGTYSVTYSVTDADGNKVTKTITVTVEDLTGSVLPNVFYLNGDTYLEGTYTGKVTKVKLQVNGVDYTTVAVTNGVLRYYAKDKILNLTDDVKILAYSASGKLIETKKVTVLDAAALKGTVVPATFNLGSDLRVQGTFTGDIKKVALSVNGTLYTSVAVAPDGTFTYYGKDKILNLTDDVKIIGYNSAGTAVSTVKVKIQDSGALSGTIKASDFVVGSDQRVAGTYTGGVKKVALSVNGTVYTSVGVAADGTFTYYAKDKVLSKTDDVKVLAYNANGDLIQTVKVNLTDSSALQGTVTPAKFTIGSDLRVTGTYTGGVKKVELEVNGTVYTGVGVAADGTFTYYAKDKVFATTDVVKVLAYNSAGTLIDTKTVALTDSAALQGNIFPTTYTLGDLRVAGTYTGGVKKVALEVNGTVYSSVGVATDGTFTYYAKDKVLAKTDVVKVIAYNANNDVVDTKTVTVTDGSSTVTGDIFPATYKINDARVTGTYTGAVKKVGLEVNGTVFAYVPVAADGTFQYYAKDKIAADTDTVKVIAYDSTNTVIKTQTVTLTK
ncbi:hypothetical protein BMT55_00910 [Listeria newyorkensis]|uniref:Cadherin domain-containing protein n=1 Tax=Listeria newyorkensis TaxID=1497681 RepID=A0ABX4XS22_9LIST|nr:MULTISPECIES: immunoglobulin-like domain-containing protein [Listeria]KGL39096.1 hypothetical protein EP56_14365 [Listeriaceae bacterium FSL A5-0209]KGL43927.1 hypothetical protein EP58_05595 [Listeria newyorkensis]KMT61799.1 cell wall surface anchor family protein [Listeria newyorkensis]PNP94940.1 hypothetical protein BMT55_00910 [Listeria newyorkensis]RQW66316.1 DUF5011 domain-containing protein [Listeria sp. SHR_NRA_18]